MAILLHLIVQTFVTLCYHITWKSFWLISSRKFKLKYNKLKHCNFRLCWTFYHSPNIKYHVQNVTHFSRQSNRCFLFFTFASKSPLYPSRALVSLHQQMYTICNCCQNLYISQSINCIHPGASCCCTFISTCCS